MAHNIGEMFYAGERPWHGLGNQLESNATMEQALAAGGLDWTVSLAPLALAGKTPVPVHSRLAVVRDDRATTDEGRVLGVVHPYFKPLQNRQGAVLFDALYGKG